MRPVKMNMAGVVGMEIAFISAGEGRYSTHLRAVEKVRVDKHAVVRKRYDILAFRFLTINYIIFEPWPGAASEIV